MAEKTSESAIREKLKRQQYGLIGKASAVKICEWQKKGLRGEGLCYKNKFYGVPTLGCVQLSTTLNYCDNKCIYCWRDMADTKGNYMTEFDEPLLVMEDAPKVRKFLLTGFGGNLKVPKEKWVESEIPKHYAISLTGEPTLYPKLQELLELIKKQKCSSFVVTNGMHPGVLLNIHPTQLYVSIDASNKDDFYSMTRCSLKDGWDRLLKTIDYVKSIREKGDETPKERTVFRVTLIKPDNMRDSDKISFAELIRRGMPKFVEFKSFMFIGSSRERLTVDHQPFYEELKQFAKEVGDLCDYVILDEHKQSKVILLVHKDDVDMKDRFIDYGAI